MIISTNELKQSILELNPAADSSILEELCFLTRKYQLRWVRSTKLGNGAFFIANQLSEAKGLDKGDYIDNWSNNSTNRIKNGASKLAGGEIKLEGTPLANFKKIYKEIYGESLGRINSLTIVDWERAYSYLVQGSTEAAKEFQTLGSTAIKTQVETEARKMAHYSIEAELHCGLAYLASMTNYTLKSEVSVKDFPDSECNCRRFDLIHQMPHRTKGKIVTIYELKRDIITLEDVESTLDNKRYLELAKARYGEHVNIVFVAPWGGEGAALERVQFLDNIEIMTLSKFATFLLDKVYDKHKDIDPYFSRVLLKQNPIIKKLVANPQDWINQKQLAASSK